MKILVYGTGENSEQAFAIFRHHVNVEIAGYVDDSETRHGAAHLGGSVIGGADQIAAFARTHGVTGGFAAIGDNHARAHAAAQLRRAGLQLVNAIHPQSMIDAPRFIGEGVMIEMGAAVHAHASIGDGTFVMGGAIVSHHSTIGRWSLLGGGTVFGGNVTIGDFTTLGCGTVVQPHIAIGDGVVTGIGTAVTRPVQDGAVVVGVPGRVVRVDARYDSAAITSEQTLSPE
jgi:sugar O-acyltransferase (sialic acid O-acetyltransferase NeuD family)